MKKITLSFLMALFLSNASQAQSNKNADEIKSIITFSKLYGIGKYFQNSKLTDRIDWEKFCILGIEKVLEAENQYELYKTCKTLFEPLSPTMRIHYGASIVNGLESPTSDKLHYREHNGPGMDNQWNFIYRLLLPRMYYTQNKTTDVLTDPGLLEALREVHTEQLDDSIFVEYYVGNGDYKTPPRDAAELKKAIKKIEIDNRGNQNCQFFSHRAASVVIFWNVIRYFYPYQASLPPNWVQCLEKYLTRAKKDTTSQEFFKTLQLMTSDINDGHGLVMNSMGNSNFISRFFEVYEPKMEIAFVENQMVVVAGESLPSSPERGDILIGVNSTPIKEVIKEQLPYLSGSSHKSKMNDFAKKFFVNFDSTSFTIQISKSNGDSVSALITKSSDYGLDYYKPNSLLPLQLIEGKALYINPCDDKFDYKKAKKMMQDDIFDTVVFDIRGQPHYYSFKLLSYCIDKPIYSSDFIVPKIYTPFFKDTLTNPNPIIIDPHKKARVLKIIAITNSSVYSFPETWLSFIKNNNLGVIIGERTAGTNGNASVINLPVWGGWFTGTITKNKGNAHHGIGIMPDIEVRPTIQGIREGKDEVLERAIEYIKNGK